DSDATIHFHGRRFHLEGRLTDFPRLCGTLNDGSTLNNPTEMRDHGRIVSHEGDRTQTITAADLRYANSPWGTSQRRATLYIAARGLALAVVLAWVSRNNRHRFWSGVSLLLFIAVLLAWIRSYNHYERFSLDRNYKTWQYEFRRRAEVVWSAGGLRFEYCNHV